MSDTQMVRVDYPDGTVSFGLESFLLREGAPAGTSITPVGEQK